ncbi:WXG100 family type VII secretion target [Microbacterium stercoris]|uniref:ESAT-6-like protein n=1 Tax=Microbacterium stercoris TaxID=2820289 RepID=A0A939QJ43_9MICO|nr:WXG100 family type VII secretion target [Microbacterium stercoris]MBO3663828.1 WXG100 family type VII secretion target [Microbacterium stercoris]
MAVFTVDTDAIAAGSGSILTTVEQVRAVTAALNAQLAPLETAWTGASSVAFQEAKAQWNGLQAQIDHTLDGLGRSLGTVGHQYADAERSMAGMFR